MCGGAFCILNLTEMDCCGCFGFLRKPRRFPISFRGSGNRFSQELLLPDNIEDADGISYSGDSINATDSGMHRSVKRSEEILLSRAQNGLICREVPVKETWKVKLSEVFHKSHLVKLRVAPSETAMTDVLREVSIMKMLDHPNIVNLIEVIDDPNTDHFYMVLEYVEGKWVCEGSGPASGLGESTSRRYLRDIVAGLVYLHSHKIVHGDIKPDNLLVTSDGKVKIGDFSVSQVFEDDNDVLRRSPGTPVFTAPECCLGLTYHGKAADTWAVGVTLYCMVLGQYPFLGDTLQDTYDKIVNNPLVVPDDMNPPLKNLLEGLLCKDPNHRITLNAVAEHPWVIGEEGPIPEYLCQCRRKSSS
ncbi:serine/threonine-protein kinase GRIK1 isoform X2 [Elaeis guineensis]|uniref:Serine/threonine-protein kinase GRIK1 isoform X3 n=1 Tax=Elaeis guineensis var. tenera TaxID=51953 RepID=A0A6I9QB97_ELAGV|nr:serine/threonine-protein kinase GRIK1 isoform X3 [Elaeis guineensis]XP_029117140.1 serine/threonine-protein kinase GRIK1 isoform X3 [Elaeis guineensis]